MHLAAESHVDRSIDGPAVFIQTNVTGTFHLLQMALDQWLTLEAEDKARFRFITFRRRKSLATCRSICQSSTSSRRIAHHHLILRLTRYRIIPSGLESHVRSAGRAVEIGEGLCRRRTGRTRNSAVVAMICDLLNAKLPVANGKRRCSLIRLVTDRPGHDRRYAIDPSRIKRDLGWRAETGFADGLAATIEWYPAEQGTQPVAMPRAGSTAK